MADSHDVPANGHLSGVLVPASARVLGRYAKWEVLALDRRARVPTERQDNDP
jgi:hypothetical protein